MTTPFPPESLPTGPGVRVLATHPAGIVALEKPAGVISHPNGPGISKNALLLAEYDEARERYTFRDGAGNSRHVRLMNRLDSPTSGVVLVATDDKIAETVAALFAGREIDKTYHAIVKGGRLVPERSVWRDTLTKSKNAGAGHVRASGGGPGGAEAVTHAVWVSAHRENPPLSLVKLEPKTGRTHQLRIQGAMRGHPVAGDRTYGDFALNKTLAARSKVFDRLFLHCSRTAFEFPWNGRTETFAAESPLPPEFALLLDGGARNVVAGGLNIRLKKRP